MKAVNFIHPQHACPSFKDTVIFFFFKMFLRVYRGVMIGQHPICFYLRLKVFLREAATSRGCALINSPGSKGVMSLDRKRVWVINHGLALCRAEEISLGTIIEKKFIATHAADNRHIIAARATRGTRLNCRIILLPRYTSGTTCLVAQEAPLYHCTVLLLTDRFNKRKLIRVSIGHNDFAAMQGCFTCA